MSSTIEALLAPGAALRAASLIGGAATYRCRGAVVAHTSSIDDRALGFLETASADDVELAIAAAHAARHACRDSTIAARVAVLEETAAKLAAIREPLARLLALEVAKPIALARLEVDRAVGTFRDAAHVAATLTGEIIPLDVIDAHAGREALVRRVPIGPVTAITPFNFPLNLVAHKVAPAIAAGCPLVLKPALAAPLTALVLAEIVREAARAASTKHAGAATPAGRWPVAALQVVILADDALAAPLISDDRIRAVTFTGSAPVGWGIRDRAGHKPVALELGGDACAIVAADADLARAVARIAWGGFAYAGQTCIAVQHVLVHASVADAFRTQFVAAVDALPGGDVLADAAVLGPVLRDRDADRITTWIDAAMVGGAHALRRGGRNGRLLGPTILTDVPETSPLATDEVFGPVVDLATWTSVEDVIARVNRSRFGLQAGVFTRDLNLVRRLSRELEVGALIVDDVPTFRSDRMPYGGVKDSGLGREGARHAIDFLSELRTVVW